MQNRPVTPTGPISAPTFSNVNTPRTKTLRARTPGLMGALVGKLTGTPKNPIKHAAMDLIEAIILDNDELLPELIKKGEAALEFAKGSNVPLNDRNPYFKMVLATFLPVARDFVKVKSGIVLTQEQAKAGLDNVSSFSIRSQADKKQIVLEHRSQHRIQQTTEFLENVSASIFKGRDFYRNIIRGYKKLNRTRGGKAKKQKRRTVRRAY